MALLIIRGPRVNFWGSQAVYKNAKIVIYSNENPLLLISNHSHLTFFLAKAAWLIDFG